MRQKLWTIAVVIALVALWVETCATFCNIIDGLPILRGLLILVLIINVLYHGELNRREFNAKQRKIKALKEQQKKAQWLAEYEEFRKTVHHAK